jgi:murein DD-endopeptidase MepM/ murein hydrolase activator NlpD
MLGKINMNSAEEFDIYIKETLQRNNTTVGIGRYNEDRIIYRRSALFGTERTIHLGVDIILPSGTHVYSPLEATVHSSHDNNGNGDYGPTVILQHEIDGIKFFTLYGHLSLDSLGKTEGQKIAKGELVGKIGDINVNGNWFEHLHFQIICDMLGKKGDFPGVANVKERRKWLDLCPDPNLILKINKLINNSILL